jgi:trimeric autotransporter adhesin
MSTKTTFKRVALGTVAVMGFGLLSVVPSQANTGSANTVVTAVSLPANAYTVSVGSTSTNSVRIVNTITGTDADTINLLAAVTTNVTGNTATPKFATTGNALVDDESTPGAVPATATNGADGAGASNVSRIVFAPGASKKIAANATAAVVGTLSFTPEAAGTYVVQLYNDVNGNNAVDAGDITNGMAITYYAYSQASNGTTVVGLVGDGGAVTANNNAVTGVAGPANTVQVRVFPSTTTDVRTLVVVSGSSASIVSSTGGTVVLAAGTNPTTATVAHQAAINTVSNFTIATPVVGTATVSIFRETAASSGIFSATAAGTVTITVAATRSAGTVSVANSTAFASTTLGAVADATTDAAMTSVVGTGTPAVRVRYTVDVLDTLGARMPLSATALTASVAGPGLLSSSNATTSTSRVLVLSGWAGSGAVDFYLASDGTAGTSTVTISWGTTVLATKTVVFTGAARTLTVGSFEPHITAAATADAFWVLAVDANSNPVAYTPVGTSSNTAVLANNITNCALADATQRGLGAPLGSNVCDVTGVGLGKTTLTIAAGSTTTNSPTLEFTVTRTTIASIVIKTDKDSYLPGEKITLSLEAKDSDGTLLGARNAGYDVLSAFAVNQALTGTALGTGALAFSAGTFSTTYFAPLVPGTVDFTATLDSAAPLAAALQGTKITKTITVSGGPAVDAASAAADAAAEATDAANAATDAANAAAEAADAATAAAQDAADAVAALATSVEAMVNALKRQITSLTNLVIKIQKKVRA